MHITGCYCFSLDKIDHKELRRQYCFADDNSVMIERDYAEALKSEFDM